MNTEMNRNPNVLRVMSAILFSGPETSSSPVLGQACGRSWPHSCTRGTRLSVTEFALPSRGAATARPALQPSPSTLPNFTRAFVTAGPYVGARPARASRYSTSTLPVTSLAHSRDAAPQLDQLGEYPGLIRTARGSRGERVLLRHNLRLGLRQHHRTGHMPRSASRIRNHAEAQVFSESTR